MEIHGDSVCEGVKLTIGGLAVPKNKQTASGGPAGPTNKRTARGGPGGPKNKPDGMVLICKHSFEYICVRSYIYI